MVYNIGFCVSDQNSYIHKMNEIFFYAENFVEFEIVPPQNNGSL